MSVERRGYEARNAFEPVALLRRGDSLPRLSAGNRSGYLFVAGLCLPDREVTSPAPCDMIGYNGSIAALVRCELISGPEFLLPPATASCWCRLLMLFER